MPQPGFDWSGLLGALIGAVAAIVAVVVTQWFERRKAHDDRIWKERSEIYLTLYRWTVASNSHLFRAVMVDIAQSHIPGVPNPPGEEIAAFADPPFLTEDERAKVWVYASAEVRQTFDKIEKMLHDLVSESKKGPITVAARREVLAATKELQNRINAEIQKNK